MFNMSIVKREENRLGERADFESEDGGQYRLVIVWC